MSNLNENRLTCNRLFRHLFFHHLQGFTGKVAVSNQKGQTWDFYFSLGSLVWATGGEHPLRRWRRLYYATVGELPDLNQINTKTSCWDCKALRHLSETNQLAPQQVKEIVQGTLLEVLLDAIQTFEAPIYKYFKSPKYLVSVSQLTGIGDEMQIRIEEGVTPDQFYRLPPSLKSSLRDLQKTTFIIWEKWVKAGLSQISPNAAPLLIKPEQLKSHVSQKVYDNLQKNLKGKTSLRDLGFKFKHGLDFIKVAQALSPYYKKNLIVFKKIEDLRISQSHASSYSSLTLTEHPMRQPLILAVSVDEESELLLSAIAREQGYMLEVIENSFEAIYKLSENPEKKPSFIFAPNEMPMIKGSEFCHLLRRFQSLQETSLIIYSKDNQPQKKLKDIVNAGANEALDYQIFTYNKISSILLKYGSEGNMKNTTHQPIPDPTATSSRKKPAHFRLTGQRPSFANPSVA